ncbi:hypothetical protein PG997_011137 [Apiospora hydei]|uniref:Uncharacterized protein n=1 Tax=Apiospora hydei TaxID=1337664 RepID=A0ABR1VI77_9PEZI
MKLFAIIISAFLLAVQAQGSYRYGENDTTVIVTSTTTVAGLSASTPTSSGKTTVSDHTATEPHVPFRHTSHLPMSHLHLTSSWSFNGTQTRPIPTGGSVTSYHGYSTSTHGSPMPSATSHSSHTYSTITAITLSTDGPNIPEGTVSDNGDQPTNKGGLMPVPIVHPTTSFSRCPESTKHSTAAPKHTGSSEAGKPITFSGFTITLPWQTITLEPTTWTLDLPSIPTTFVPLPSEPAADGPHHEPPPPRWRSTSLIPRPLSLSRRLRRRLRLARHPLHRAPPPGQHPPFQAPV